MSSIIQINQGIDDNVQQGIRLERTPGQSFRAGDIGPNNVGAKCFTDTVTVSGWTGTANLATVSICISDSTDELEMRVFDGAPQVSDSILVTSPKYMGSAFATPGTTATNELSFDFSSASITLTAGNDYYWIVTKPGNTNTLMWFDPNTSHYADGQRIFINGGSSAATTITDLASTSNQEQTFRLSVTLNGAGGGGDPIIVPINNIKYHLPVNDKIYCLLDTLDKDDRLVVNAKTQIWKNGKSYFRYVYIYYNSEEFIMRLPQLWIVNMGTDQDVTDHKLPLNPINRHNTDNIVEIRRTSKMRRFKLITNNYGDYYLVFYKNKNRFFIYGDITNFQSNAVGALIDSSKNFQLAKLNYVSPI